MPQCDGRHFFGEAMGVASASASAIAIASAIASASKRLDALRLDTHLAQQRLMRRLRATRGSSTSHEPAVALLKLGLCHRSGWHDMRHGAGVGSDVA
jgi:Leu/Phe-tRNA-protein transferase